MPSCHPDLHHLRQAGVSVVVDARDPSRLPALLHWGGDLGTDVDLTELALATARVTGSSLAETHDPGLLAEPSTGWLGQPSLLGHRSGRAWSPRFRTVGILREEVEGTQRLVVDAVDDHAGLGLRTELEMLGSGLLRVRHDLSNEGEEDYQLDALVAHLPVGAEATDLLDLTGRHCLDRVPVRTPFTVGTHLHDTRRGRTGADGASVMVAGETGFGFGRGEVWGVHLGWSGNHRGYAEHTSTGERILAAGELLWPGEIALAPGARYRSPWLYGSYGDAGLDSMSSRFHAFVRGLPHIADRDRLITLNSWEALGFGLNTASLVALAEAGAEVGVERFVVDDGWFSDRRDDTRSLGDWSVAAEVFPEGLGELATRVRELGMQLGIWFEPEMINEDSALARHHPEWILQVPGRLPERIRHQQVLDLTVPAAWDHVLETMSAIIATYGIGYVKWDHNRDLVDAGRWPGREAATHLQTKACYELMAELRRRFPHLALESCASGGARIDLGIVEHVDRFWTSDNVDPRDRQTIQRWTQLLMPPEVLGAHVGAPVAGASQRTHRLRFRAGTALFGDFGVEWDIAQATPAERTELAEWIALAKRFRPLLRSGRVVRSDHPDAATWVNGVVAPDGDQALYAVVSMETTTGYTPGRIRLPGLDRRARYRLSAVEPAVAHNGYLQRPAWIEHGGLVLPGSTLATVGVEAPVLWPDDIALVLAERVSGEAS